MAPLSPPETSITNKKEITMSSSLNEPEFVGVILASSSGARLFPLTSNGMDADDVFGDEESISSLMSDDDRDIVNNKSKNESHDVSNKDKNFETKYMPKHLLPLIGTPVIHHLLLHLNRVGFELCVVAIGHDDTATLASLLQESFGAKKVDNVKSSNTVLLEFESMKIKVVTLPKNCAGSAEALRHLSSPSMDDGKSMEAVIPPTSHAVVMPGDLILYGNDGENDCDALGMLADAHRRGYYNHGMPKGAAASAVTMLLTDVGEEDENGVPLKESAKGKKGGIAREDEDIEYIALSSSSVCATSTFATTAKPQRILLKQSKYNVEEDEENTGSTPKLAIPKARLHSHNSFTLSKIQQMSIRTDWADVHVYVLSPWVLKLLQARPFIKELQKELIPFLISRQFRGVKRVFGIKQGTNKRSNAVGGGATDKTEEQEKRDALLESVLANAPFSINSSSQNFISSVNQQRDELEGVTASIQSEGDYPFLITAQVLNRASSKLTLRACNIPNYLYGCREVLAHAIATQPDDKNNTGKRLKQQGNAGTTKKGSTALQTLSSIPLPSNTTINAKFNSITLSDTTIGDKVQVKASTIGKKTKIGNRCRLNNVVVMDNVVIGDNCILQNSVLAAGSIVGDNCNLNDCQVGPGTTVSDGTKGKGESFME